MTLDFWHRFDRAVRGLTPLALTLLLALLSVVPLRIPGFAPITPALTVIAVYYWSIYRPDLLPLIAIFLVGIVQDALGGTPLGLSSLVLLLVQAVVVAQRPFFHGKTFLVEWWGFMLVAPGALLAGWILASLYFGAVVTPKPLGFQLLLTIAFYPCLTWLLARVQQRVLRHA